MAAGNDAERLMVVVRKRRAQVRHHGGQWKIAYADFVTAMMAFFLLMWLLGSTTKGDLEGIAEYFRTPLKVALAGGSGSGDSSSVIKGGGRDLTRSVGQVKEGDLPTRERIVNIKAAQAEAARLELLKLKSLKQRIEQAIDANPLARQFKSQIRLDITDEGLRVQIVDEKNRPMFANGSAELLPYTKEILHQIGQVLNGVENKITLEGHTDATPYSSGEKGYSNWELSSDRANASRRELIAGGMDGGKVLRVVGLAAAVPYDRQDPFDPVNRRISIIIMKREAAEEVTREGAQGEAGSGSDPSPLKSPLPPFDKGEGAPAGRGISAGLPPAAKPGLGGARF